MKAKVFGCFTLLLLATTAYAQKTGIRPLCDENAPLCTETHEVYTYENKYTGHDEPSLLFYSNTPGSGNSSKYLMVLPNDPPRLPTSDGKGGTFNFQLHPAFWFGMALCDSQSAPNPGAACPPDTDAHIFDDADPASDHYIGKHPGTAFMEMQFYPPGWVAWPPGNSCDSTKWCAALNIDSLTTNLNTGISNNATCLGITGIEPVNFAFITKNGVPVGPPNPINSTLATFTADPTKVLLMNSGDELLVDLRDTPDGFQVTIIDRTTGERGVMVASAANGFGQVKYDPASTTCDNIPYNYHPMYSTSSEHTRVPWAAHSYNVAFSDEIGHFEYCTQTDGNGGCLVAGPSDLGGVDADDAGCFDASQSTRIRIGGCLGTDVDFDGVPYQLTWPGTLLPPSTDRQFNPRSVLFTSPVFNGGRNYERIAFETDLPRIEFATSPACNRRTGVGCVNPPVGANFYPFFTTRNVETRSADESCVWQLGGAHIPGTTNTFGGSSTAEYGALLYSVYPAVGGSIQRINNFRQVLNNPCRSSLSDD